MSQRRKSRSHRNLGTATALTGVSGNAAHAVPLHSVDTRIHGHDSTVWTRRRVLLLNSTFEPLTALSVRRAVVMVLCGKADVVHEDPTGPEIHLRSFETPEEAALDKEVRAATRKN